MNERYFSKKVESILSGLGLSKEQTKVSSKVINLVSRFALGAVFFIVGFNFSNTLFFHENPLFGVPFLAEILISLAMAAFGFHTVPILAESTRAWMEGVVTKTVSNIVSDFWEQQSKRMQTARRERQKKEKDKNESKAKERISGSLLLDTSVLIDSRVVEIAKSGFLSANIVILQTVIDELHLLSDSEDSLKRQKGRRGLDVINELKKVAKVSVFKNFDPNTRSDSVDKELVMLARKFKARLMTLDFNLNKVARVSGVRVLNINELSNAVRPSFLPGEKLKVKIVQEGKAKDQGIGYLQDGTMVVIEGGKNSLNEEKEVKVTRIIQTSAGKMIFCVLQTD